VIVTVTGDQLRAALLNGFQPACDPAFPGGTGRFPQVAGLRVTYACNNTTPVVTSLMRADGTAIGATDTVRLVTNDFMLGGGDGYTALGGGTDILQPGDGLLDVTIEYITAHSPVAPVVEGRVVRTP
jgi:2',3'-cyclic-nucleotide 2'-phosphodiesterase (5'-nucleotidase family)